MGVAAELQHEAKGRCLNCGAPLVGPYCAQCGQRQQDPDPTFRELIAEAWSEFVSVDGRMMSSVRLLVCRPGALTRQYLEGHRARFVPPLRLYLLCSVAFFVLSALHPPTRGRSRSARVTGGRDTEARRVADSLVRQQQAAQDSVSRALLERHGFAAPALRLDSTSRALADSLRAHDEAARLRGAPQWLRNRYERSFRHIVSDKHNFSPQVSEQAPRLMFVLVPLFAVLLAVAYRSRKRRYPVHLVTALHLHAFAFLALGLFAIWNWMPWSPIRTALATATALGMAVYFPIALREVYGGTVRGAVARVVLLSVEYAVIGLAAFVVMVMLLLLTY